jgi:hypothetical protein
MFGPYGAGTITLTVKGDDLAITVALHDVRDLEGAPVTATGRVGALVRATLVDPVGGNMTVPDLVFAWGSDVPVENGVAKVKTTLATIFSEAGVSSPLVATSCKSFELAGYPVILDPAGAIFAKVGLFLP